MKKIAALCFFCVLCTICSMVFGEKPKVNYDESQVQKYRLPSPFIVDESTYIETPEQWNSIQRPRLLKLFKEEMYGQMPKVDRKKLKFEVLKTVDHALEGKAIRKEIRIYFDAPNKTPKADMLVYIPKNAAGPVPCFFGLNFKGNHSITQEKDVLDPGLIEGSRFKASDRKDLRGASASRWQLDKVIDRGYALATIYYEEIEPDSDANFKYGVHPLFNKEFPDQTKGDYPGAITAWAWGLSRGLDCLNTIKEINPKKVIVIGHSRLGKTALWAGVNDPRFAAVISNNSGCGGAAISRRNYGETLAIMNKAFPHWFCANFKKYDENVNSLPFDQHELISMIAMRPVYIASALEDRWADPKGEFLGATKADAIYKLMRTGGFGNVPRWQPKINQSYGDIIRYHIREGKHDVTAFDWDQYLKFADELIK